MMMMDPPLWTANIITFHYEHVGFLLPRTKANAGFCGVAGIRAGDRSHPTPASQPSRPSREASERDFESTKLQVTHLLQIREFYSRKDYAFAAFLASVRNLHS